MVVSVMGCSKKETPSSSKAATVVAADLGKDAKYFEGIYGTAISEKQLTEFRFSLPPVANAIKISEPFISQQYSAGKLSVQVLFTKASSPAIWVKYSMISPWTDEQIKSALVAYDKKWDAVTVNQGVSGIGEVLLKSIAPAVAAATYQSESGVFASKEIGNTLTIYSPALVQTLRQTVAEQEKQKREAPKF